VPELPEVAAYFDVAAVVIGLILSFTLGGRPLCSPCDGGGSRANCFVSWAGRATLAYDQRAANARRVAAWLRGSD